ncbi:MAG: hypothetical protein ABIJ40_09820, partial [Bacteroidota bacterium]
TINKIQQTLGQEAADSYMEMIKNKVDPDIALRNVNQAAEQAKLDAENIQNMTEAQYVDNLNEMAINPEKSPDDILKVPAKDKVQMNARWAAHDKKVLAMKKAEADTIKEKEEADKLQQKTEIATDTAKIGSNSLIAGINRQFEGTDPSVVSINEYLSDPVELHNALMDKNSQLYKDIESLTPKLDSNLDVTGWSPAMQQLLLVIKSEKGTDEAKIQKIRNAIVDEFLKVDKLNVAAGLTKVNSPEANSVIDNAWDVQKKNTEPAVTPTATPTQNKTTPIPKIPNYDRTGKGDGEYGGSQRQFRGMPPPSGEEESEEPSLKLKDIIDVYKKFKSTDDPSELASLGMWLDANYDSVAAIPGAKIILRGIALKYASVNAASTTNEKNLIHPRDTKLGSKEDRYTGGAGIDLVEAYIYGKELDLPKAKHAPKSSAQFKDMPFYSLKNKINIHSLFRSISVIAPEEFGGYSESPESTIKNIEDFYSNKENQEKIIKSPEKFVLESAIAAEINKYGGKRLFFNVGKNTTSFGYDKEKGEPYISLYDIWDFSNKTGDYTKSYDTDNMDWQRSLMEKIGKPFGFYDRIYFSELKGN